MGADVQNDPGSIKTELIQVIRDFSHYLSYQQQIGNLSFGISEKSEDQINNWGNNWETKNRAQDPFFFQGPENADIFILDSEIVCNYNTSLSGKLPTSTSCF